MQESLLFITVIFWEYSIANTSCRLCIIVNIMQVGAFTLIRYVSVFIIMAHNLDISEF